MAVLGLVLKDYVVIIVSIGPISSLKNSLVQSTNYGKKSKEQNFTDKLEIVSNLLIINLYSY